MGLFSSLAPVMSAAKGTPSPYSDFWYTPEGWMLPLEAAGISMTPELALTLSHVYCAVDTFSSDFGSMACQMYRNLPAGGKEKVRFDDKQWGRLAYRLRWQPNMFQTAKAFWTTIAWQYELRPFAYAEIVRFPGTDEIAQIIPRHPDRVTAKTVSDGINYELREPEGYKPRTVLGRDMLVIRNASTDGLNAIGRTRYGAKALSTGLTLQNFTHKYFTKGATAALLATYKGDKEEFDEAKLHKSVSRFMNDVGGVMLVPEDIDVKSLGVSPEKAELLGLKNYSGRDVARMFKMPPHKLMIEGTQTYASQSQSATEYANGTLLPFAVEVEQAVQMVVLGDTDVFIKFNMDYVARADTLARYQAYAIGIRSRVLRPSEAREFEDLNPDPELDDLSARDFQPGQSGGGSSSSTPPSQEETPSSGGARSVREVLFAHDAAQRVINRERIAVEKLQKKHATDATALRSALLTFYHEHGEHVSQTLRISLPRADAICDQHAAYVMSGAQLSDDWARIAVEELTTIALTTGR